MKVKGIMSFPAITEDEDASVAIILKHMEQSRIGGVVITSEGKPIGIIVDHDIAAKVIMKDRNPDEVKAKEIMSSPLTTVGAGASVEEASGLLARKGIRRLPVVEGDTLVGIVSIRNILTGEPVHVRKYLF
uniref:Inosine-5'-monophosphate dehydrogenase n=1 Tax=Candidatus Methanophagaceae archaeon ANME-1 ERB6 TaxID=2759912 RepID=A0A7G9YZ93_9EURY|nr:inosine-5'-monophosphate dehydrogenase [Methanosarcinales archaeon ANME-1 ERB6]